MKASNLKTLQESARFCDLQFKMKMKFGFLITAFLMNLNLFSQPSYKILLEAENGKGYFKVEGHRTWLEIEATEKYFFSTKKIECSIFADPIEHIYKQNEIERKIPEGTEDILSIIRKKAESHYQGATTDTLQAFVDGKIKKIIIRDYSHSPERTLEMSAQEGDLGGGIKSIEAKIYLLNDENSKDIIPLINLKVSHEKKKDPIYFFTKGVEK